MVKRIRMEEFNQHLENVFAKLRPLLGASVKQLQHYAISTLTDESSNGIILHTEWNGIGDSKEV